MCCTLSSDRTEGGTEADIFTRFLAYPNIGLTAGFRIDHSMELHTERSIELLIHKTPWQKGEKAG